MKDKIASALRSIIAFDGRSFLDIAKEGYKTYQFLNVLYCNACSVVFKMKDDKGVYTIKFRTAKVIHKKPIWREQMKIEAQVLSQMKSHRIPTFVDFDPLFPCLVLTYMQGKDFSRYGKLPLSQALHAIYLVCDPIDELHRMGYVHCDIKPMNIFHTKDYKVKLIDFGTVCGIGERDAKTVSTIDVLGTIGYMPPELGKKRGGYVPASDIFSLCTTFFALLTGIKLERERASFDEILAAHASEVENLDPRVYQIIKKGTMTEINDRYQSISELKKDLSRCFTR